MSPLRIFKKARAMMLDIIAICDHNSADNVVATMQVAEQTRKGKQLTVLAGMEITSKEEVHVIAVFDAAENALALQAAVYAALPSVQNQPDVFGEQLIVNELDEVEGYNDRMLIGATNLTLKELVEKIHRFNGLAIAAHIDRHSYSIIGQLGFIPDSIDLDGLELSHHAEYAGHKLPEISKYPVITSSDAHELDQIGCACTNFYIAEPSIAEIKKALQGVKGRAYDINRKN